jgi:hypothetical protein
LQGGGRRFDPGQLHQTHSRMRMSRQRRVFPAGKLHRWRLGHAVSQAQGLGSLTTENQEGEVKGIET